MKKDIVEYMARWHKFQQIEVKHQHLGGLLCPLTIPKWKWEVTSIEFITRLPMTIKQHDSIMVVVDKFSNAYHFIPIKSMDKVGDIETISMKEIFLLHGIPKEIVLDKNSKFTSKFRKGLFKDLGNQLHFSTTYHP